MESLSRNRHQILTYWKVTGMDGDGDETFAAPIQVIGKWEKRDRIFHDVRGEERRANNVITTEIEIFTGDFIALGDFFTAPIADPKTVAGAEKIEGSSAIPNLRNTALEFVALA